MKVVYNRGSFIKNIIEEFNYEKYLEIGLSHNPIAPYRMLNEIPLKHSVDTDETTGADFIMTSDDFFSKLESGELQSKGLDNDYKWDIIFIDGNHYAIQVYSDLLNALKHISDNGVIVMHDVLPQEYYRTLETPIPITYDGKPSHIPVMQCDAWKVVHFSLKNMPQINVCTVPENEGGLGVITKNLDNNRTLLSQNCNPFFQFKEMNLDMINMMNVVSSDKIIEWIENPFQNHCLDKK